MIAKKHISITDIFKFAWRHLTWLVPWMSFVSALYYFTHWTFITIPLLPLSLIGTAVSFYIGFKNNQSYDRLWEARTIWGAIVNNSRKLCTMIKNYRDIQASPMDSSAIRKEIVFRHIAYIYQLREQLLKPAPWEHVKLKWIFGSLNQHRRNKIFNNYEEELNQLKESIYLSEEEKNRLERFRNKSVQLLDNQTKCVQALYEANAINLMHQIDLQAVLNSFHDEQGKAERIKSFPFPRQFAGSSFAFVCLFVFLLPFGMVGEFAKMGDDMIWLSVPVGTAVGFVYVIIELIGDYSENPFEGLSNDIPMLSICRTIEIDMLEMIGEPHHLKEVEPKENVLL